MYLYSSLSSQVSFSTRWVFVLRLFFLVLLCLQVHVLSIMLSAKALWEANSKSGLIQNLNHIPLFEQLGVSPFYEGMPASAKLAAIGFMLFGCGN